GPGPGGQGGGRLRLVNPGAVVGRRRRCVAPPPWSRSVAGSHRAGCARSVGSTQARSPLAVRSWTCTQCGITHDRDLNAARNILVEGRMVAAGLAQTLNAGGGGVRAGLVPAAACEARTHQGAARVAR